MQKPSIDLQAWFGDGEKIACPDCRAAHAVKLNERQGFCPDCGLSFALDAANPTTA